MGSEALLPQARGEFCDAAGGMHADALQDIDVYTYLVDVLQRVAEHPASRVAELTPRLWKRHFATNPLRSASHARVA